MKRLRVAIDQMAPVLGDIDANIKSHQDAVRWAKSKKAELLIFPELSLSGYHVRGMVPHVALAAQGRHLKKLAESAGSLGVIAGFVEKSTDGQFYNSAAYIRDGHVQGVQRKLFLPNYGMFDEKRFFASGHRVSPFEMPWGRVGVLICFDALHPAAAYLFEQAGARVLVTISASPMRGIRSDGSMSAEESFRLAQRAHARLLGLVTILVNRVGTEEGLTFWGGSHVYDPFGDELLSMPTYEPQRAICDIDLETVSRARTLFPHLKEGRPGFVLQEMWRLRMESDGDVAQRPPNPIVAGGTD